MKCRNCNKCLYCDNKCIIKIGPFRIEEEDVYCYFCSVECTKDNMLYGGHYSIEVIVSGDKEENKNNILKVFNAEIGKPMNSLREQQ